ncbi:MAG: thiol-disulfide isomerase [Candidatus Acidiferrales bacterium]
MVSIANIRRAPAIAICVLGMLLTQGSQAQSQASPVTPTFYRDVLPILERRCQNCHRPGEMAFPLMTADQAASRARGIRESVVSRRMPPWLADPTVGHFANDPSLSNDEIKILVAWSDTGAHAGNPHDAKPPKAWPKGWNIPAPDAVLDMPQAISIPSHGDIDYTYEIIPTGFQQNRWVQMAEFRSSSGEHVHHAVVYIRPPESKWLRGAPVGVPFTAETLTREQDRRDAMWTTSDMLLVYAPGSAPEIYEPGMAKLIPAGSDLVIQMHYMAMGHAARDLSGVGLVFAKHPPKQQVLTLQLTNDHFVIPPRVDDYRVEARGILPSDTTLLGFFPHMHWRGKRFEYNVIHPDGRIEPLLKVRWDFEWQLNYQLAEPRFLKAGTMLQAVAWYDNSSHNPHNPDPNEEVRWGEQTYEEMMVGFFDIAVSPDTDKTKYFNPGSGPTPPR